MWLLQTENMELCEFYKDVPRYAILSHRWEEQELSFENVGRSSSRNLKGYRKVKEFCKLARQSGFDYVWVDTCCINKLSSAELNEAINSMYKWYEEATVCYVYLSDVAEQKDLQKSLWFSRGWTLQELLAPRKVHFFTSTWEPLASREVLAPELEKITGIPQDVLRKSKNIADFCIAERMSWYASRDTTRVEDRAYCLLGIFDVNMPLLYGEGEKAFQRLQEEIMKVNTDLSLFLWQGHPCDRFGMLAASPSCFINLPDCLTKPLVRESCKLSKGWTVNNAAMSLDAIFLPHYLTKGFNEIYVLLLHEPGAFSFGDAHGLCIFIEKVAADRLDSPYRRVVLDEKSWTIVKWPDWCEFIGSFPKQQPVLISREPLSERWTEGVRGISVRLRMRRPTICTARARDLNHPKNKLCDWPLAKHEPLRDGIKCRFDAGPHYPIGILGHVTVVIVESIQMLFCFGLDNAFRPMCFVLFFSGRTYDSGVEASSILSQYDALLSGDHAGDEKFDPETYLYAFRGRKGVIKHRSSSDELTGFCIYSMRKGSGTKASYEFQVYFDADAFAKTHVSNFDLVQVLNDYDVHRSTSIRGLLDFQSCLDDKKRNYCFWNLLNPITFL